MPIENTVGVLARVTLGVGAAPRIGERDEPVAALGQMRAAQRLAHLDELALLIALVGDEEDVDLTHRVDRLERQMTRGARADTDDANLARGRGVRHDSALPHRQV